MPTIRVTEQTSELLTKVQDPTIILGSAIIHEAIRQADDVKDKVKDTILEKLEGFVQGTVEDIFERFHGVPPEVLESLEKIIEIAFKLM